jgi:hypothetical protein
MVEGALGEHAFFDRRSRATCRGGAVPGQDCARRPATDVSPPVQKWAGDLAGVSDSPLNSALATEAGVCRLADERSRTIDGPVNPSRGICHVASASQRRICGTRQSFVAHLVHSAYAGRRSDMGTFPGQRPVAHIEPNDSDLLLQQRRSHLCRACRAERGCSECDCE